MGARSIPTLTFLPASDGVVQARFDDFGEGRTILRGIPVKKIRTADGKTVTVATVYDLLMAQYGVSRGLPGEYPRDYDDDSQPYTPAWAEKYTGMGRDVVIRFAREWAKTAELTKGRCMVIIGAGVNHWYHANLMYRAAIHALMFSGCVGVNGGGLAHYVGQEKSRRWNRGRRSRSREIGSQPLACRTRRAGTTSTRISGATRRVSPITTRCRRIKGRVRSRPATPLIRKCAPCATVGCRFDPRNFNFNSLELVKQAEAAGAKNQDEINAYVVRQLSENKLKFSVVRTPTPRRIGRGSGSSGAATRCWRAQRAMSSS